jgi:pimeloyl-ACP methyl ester carboxylesterase
MNEARRDEGPTVRYGDEGQGEPALLCLPGWCATRGAFADLSRALAPRHRVLTPDWRGHGISDGESREFGLAQLVEDALAVVAASGAERIVPLATAHAGWVAIELRRALGETRVPGLLLVDWIVTPAPPPFLDALTAMQDPARWQAARDGLFAMWLEGLDHDGITRFVREEMGAFGAEMWARASREISGAYRRAQSPLDELGRLSPPPATLHLYAQPNLPAYLEAQQSFAAAHDWFQVQRLDGKSHFPTMEIPAQLVDPIEEFLQRC